MGSCPVEGGENARATMRRRRVCSGLSIAMNDETRCDTSRGMSSMLVPLAEENSFCRRDTSTMSAWLVNDQ